MTSSALEPRSPLPAGSRRVPDPPRLRQPPRRRRAAAAWGLRAQNTQPFAEETEAAMISRPHRPSARTVHAAGAWLSQRAEGLLRLGIRQQRADDPGNTFGERDMGHPCSSSDLPSCGTVPGEPSYLGSLPAGGSNRSRFHPARTSWGKGINLGPSIHGRKKEGGRKTARRICRAHEAQRRAQPRSGREGYARGGRSGGKQRWMGRA